MDKRAHGLINIKIDGDLIKAKGNFKYNLGHPKREAIIGVDGVHGYKETHTVPFVEGDITVDGGFALKDLLQITSATIILELKNGKVITFKEAWVNSEGTVEIEEGNLSIRFESTFNGEEIAR